VTGKAPGLCAALAAATGIPRKTVGSYVAYLRRDRLLPASGRRGEDRAIGSVTASHAATLLIALLASDKPCNAADAVRRFGPLFFRGCGVRQVFVDGESRCRLDEALTENDPICDTFENVVTKAILWFQTGYEMLPGALPIAQVGVTGGAAPSAFLEAVIPKTFTGSAAFVSAIFKADEDPEVAQRGPLAPLQFSRSIRWQVLSALAAALGPISDRTDIREQPANSEDAQQILAEE
jgi:hypothetical protein